MSTAALRPPAPPDVSVGDFEHQGLAALRAGDAPRAWGFLSRAVALAPERLDLRLRLAQTCCLSGRVEQAAELYRQVLERQPGEPEATHNLVALLLRAGAVGEARAVLHGTLARLPEVAWLHHELGLLEQHHGALEAAARALRRAAELDPAAHPPHHHLAQVLRALGEDRAAVEAYRAAIDRRPDLACSHVELADLALHLGDLETGFVEHEWRFHAGGATPRREGFDAPVWDGGQLDGETVMVWIEQGLGDHLQFARYAREIARRGGRVWLQTPEPLARLYAASLDGVERLVIGDEAPGRFDFQIPLMSLARIFGTTLETIPGRAPYLAPPAEDRRAARELLAAHERAGGERPLRVGVVWASCQSHPAAARRDLPIQALSPLAQRAKTAVYGLQFGERAADLRGCPQIVDLAERVGDFASTAALALEMDVVLTVDTAMAHLAGAVGQRTWVLLGEGSDWRWLREREDSPWYPSLRLFRQRRPGDWGEVLERVGEALETLANQGTGGLCEEV